MPTISTLSTYLNYRVYTADLNRTLARIAVDPQVARDAQYYNENIGKVKSVDDFLNNTRLFSYAMKAYGLEDMSYAKAFMRKVLTSDVNDQTSFVRKLTDSRFLAFAKAFNFSTDGSVTASAVAAQDPGDETDTIGLYSQQRINKGTAAAAAAGYYQNNIATVQSVDEFLARPELLNYALVAYGLDPARTSNATLRAVLTSDLSDPGSYANQIGASNPAYLKFAAAFSFSSDGSVPQGGAVQTAAQIANTVYLNYDATGTGASPAAAAFKTQYYQNNISSITNVDELLANDNLLNYALTAFGLDPALQSKTVLRQVLTSDLSDPQSVANQQSNAAYRQLAAAFNFQTDGTLADGTSAQSANQLQQTVQLYASDYDAAALSSQKTETTYYQQAIGSIGTVDALLKNSRLYNYILTAYGIDSKTVSQVTIKKVLTSDSTDPGSFANRSANSAFQALAAAYNFDSDGNAKTLSTAQSNSSIISTIQRYNKQAGDTTAQQSTTKAEDTYYSQTIGNIKSVDEFLKDRRLVTFVLKAFGFGGETISDTTLRKLLTSDVFDPKSYVNKTENKRFRDLVAAFNFDTEGKVSLTPKTEAQTRSNIVATADLYLRQTMEQEAGDQSDGLRLALYFQRKASTITSVYSILADSALLQVVRTALGFSASMSNADIDVQASMITKKLNLDDLKDPKKLEKFLAQFSALYDVNNSATDTSWVNLLFSR